MMLLGAVAAGEVVRGGPHPTHASAPYLLDGHDVGSVVMVLARYDIIRAPMSGPPTLEPRGGTLLDAAFGC
jgi:hypothetical protein